MRKAEINFWVDAAIGLAFGVSAISGIVFLPLLGLSGPGRTTLLGLNLRVWRQMHTISSLVMVGGVLIHLMLHWRWITCMVGNVFKPKAPARRRTSKTRDVSTESA